MIKAILAVFLVLLSPGLAATVEPLRPSEAFKLTTEVLNENTIRATWNITDGYYLYRDKVDFVSETDAVLVSHYNKPIGKQKKDPTFGDVEIYRGRVSFDLPLERQNPEVQILKLLNKSQGCADLGICYPPQKQTIEIKLPEKEATVDAIAPITGISSASDKPFFLADQAEPTGISSISDITGIADITGDSANTADALLPPDEAFRFDIAALDGQTLTARWNVTPGHYLYQNKMKFSIVDAPSGITLGEPDLPEGYGYDDPYFGYVVTYKEDVEIKVPVNGISNKLTIKTEYQGCSKVAGICYPPQFKTEVVDLSSFNPAPDSAPDAEITKEALQSESPSLNTAIIKASAPPESEQHTLGDILKNKGIFTIVGAFFAAGLLLTFTPCVFPMIPILSGIITGQSGTPSRGKSFLLSLAYVVPMALTYALAGVIAGYTGANLQIALQNPWVISIFALLFVVLSLSMFGFYELQMPSAIQNRLNSISNGQRGGSLIGAGIMGVLSALIVGPCVTAPLIAALTYIANTKDLVLGGVSLFMLGMGMGAPLLLIGITAGSVLPKAGAWMDTVKHIFGVLMLGLAIWMLDRIVAPQITLLLTGILLIGSAIYLGATDTLTESSGNIKRLWKSCGLVSLLLGAILVIGAASGSKSYFSPLAGLATANANSALTESNQARHTSTNGVQFKRIKNLSDLQNTLDEAAASQRPVMFDFYAYWCLPCRAMEEEVFNNAETAAILGDTIVIQADVTAVDDEDTELMKAMSVIGPPQILFYDREGKESKPYRVVGEMDRETFQAHVKQFLTTL